MKRLLSLVTAFLIVLGCSKSDVRPRPIADFQYTISSRSTTERIISFVNTSKNADRYQWSSPTDLGLALSTKDLQISISSNQRYVVALTAKNDVGEDTKTQTIDITDIPTTGSVVFWSQVGDKGNITINLNGTYQGLLTKYINNSSTPPACNSEGFVTVTLPAGTYPFTAKSQGTTFLAWNGTITVKNGECNNLQLTR